jgi:diguanylate cyclase (GGDEF)-like protein
VRDGGRHREDYDDVLAEGLPPACLVLAAVFCTYALWHPVALAGRAAAVMTAVAVMTSSLMLLTWLRLRRRGLPTGGAHPVAGTLAGVVLANCAVQYALTEQAFLGVNVLLVLVGTGVCLIDPRWVAGLLAAEVAAWTGTVAVVTGVPAVTAALPNLALGAVMGALANAVRLGTLHRLLDTQAELRALSQRDELTGLLNRRGFLEAAQHRLDTGRTVRVWFVDVDDLKAVNDEHGHDVGDVLLVSVATALGEVFSGGVVARLSGDEFAVVEDHGAGAGQERALRALEERLVLAAHVTGLPVAVSTGVATSVPGSTLTELLSSADAAMYARKTARRTIRLPAVDAAHEAAAER